MRSSRGENTDEVLEKVKPRAKIGKSLLTSSRILKGEFSSLFGNVEFFFLGDRFSTPFAFPLFLRRSCSIARDARRESARSLSLSLILHEYYSL